MYQRSRLLILSNFRHRPFLVQAVIPRRFSEKRFQAWLFSKTGQVLSSDRGWIDRCVENFRGAALHESFPAQQNLVVHHLIIEPRTPRDFVCAKCFFMNLVGNNSTYP